MTVAGVAPEYLAFETLPVAIVALRQERVVYANRAWEELVGMQRSEAIGMTGAEIIFRTVDPTDRHWLYQHRLDTERRGDTPPAKLWFHVPVPTGGRRLMHMQSWPAVVPGDQIFALWDADEEARSRDLTHQLVTGAASLLRYHDEASLLEAAVEVLAEQKLYCALVFPEGERLRLGPIRQPPELIQAVRSILGIPTEGRFYPRERLPHLLDLERTRRARFHQDMSQWGEVALPPEIFERFRPQLRATKGLDAPLFVDEALYGFLLVQSETLSPASAAAIELFATHVGAALENVRTHQKAQLRFEEVQRLQSQIIARERLSILGEAAAVMAHEMQNPLGVILNGVTLLERLSTGEGPVVLKMIEEEARSLERLARDLLSWAKPFSASFSLLAVSELMNDVAAQLIATTPARIHVRPCDPQLQLWGDGHLLKLALANLLRNALQASPPLAPVELWAERCCDTEAIKLVVEDRGGGVPEPLRHRIFEPFFTSRAQGSGLGLALVARVVKAHAGTIRVLDAEPTGARFELELPVPGDLSETLRSCEA